MTTLTAGEQHTALVPTSPRKLPGSDVRGGIVASSNLFLGFLAVNTLVVQHTATGIIPVFQAAGNVGDQYANSGRETLLIHNNGSTSVTVTLLAQTRCNVTPGFLHDRVVTVLPGGEGSIGPAEYFIYNDTNGYVQITYSTTIGVTVALTAA